MAAPPTAQDSHAGAPGSTASVVLAVLTCVVLALLSALHLIYIIPVFQDLFAAHGRAFSFPTRLAIGIARFGPLLLVLGAVGLGMLYRRGRRGPAERSQFQAALSATSVVLALYLGLVTCAYLDAAIVLPWANR